MLIIIDIFIYILIEITLWLSLWILAVSLWVICLPISLFLVSPFYIICFLYNKNNKNYLKSKYTKLFNYWIDLGLNLVP